MRKDTGDTGGVLHREIEACNSAITPANDRYLGDVEVIKDGYRITGKVIVVESGEICVGRSALASRAIQLSVVGFFKIGSRNEYSCRMTVLVVAR